MPRSTRLLACVAVLGLAGGVVAATRVAPVKPTKAAAPATAEKPPKPKLSMHQARAIARSAAPGKIISSEYEKEGGSWRYSFDIHQKNNVQEIGVDAMTGKIVENKSEGKTDVDRVREAKHKKK
jgi:hypothetical protein